MIRLLPFVLHKLRRTPGSALAAWFGLFVAIAFAMSIPMYGDGALRQVAAHVLKQAEGGLAPASLLIKYQPRGTEPAEAADVTAAAAWLRGEWPAELGLPLLEFAERWSLRTANVRAEDAPNRFVRMRLAAQGDLEAAAELTRGRWMSAAPSAEPGGDPGGGPGEGGGGEIEAAVHEDALARNGWSVGERLVYETDGYGGARARVRVRLVGAFRPKDAGEARWHAFGDAPDALLLVSPEAFVGRFVEGREARLDAVSWYYAFDASELRSGQLRRVIEQLERADVRLAQRLEGTAVQLSFLDTMRAIRRENGALLAMLFALAAPSLALILYYTAANARQSLERQRADIAVLAGRGASPGQVVAAYAFESALLAATAFAAAVGAAWLLAQGIGSASGFLSFVRGRAFEAGLPPAAFLAGAATALLSVAANTLPALRHAKTSVVDFARERDAAADASSRFAPLADAAALAAALGGYALARSGAAPLAAGGGAASPFFALLPALFLFGGSLLVLRLFPRLAALLRRIREGRLAAPIYVTLAQLSRDSGQYRPVMLLLMMTIGMGVFDAAAARTLEANAIERILYRYGADAVLHPVWDGERDRRDIHKIYYTEPPFDRYRGLPGVAAEARVLRAEAKASAAGKPAGTAQLLALVNTEAADAAWLAERLFPVHPFLFLDALGSHPQAALVSERMAASLSLRPGDEFELRIGYEQTPVAFVVAGVIPYFPTLDPERGPFVVANLEYVFSEAPKFPYEIWLKMEPGAPLRPAVEKLVRDGLPLARVDDARGELVDRKNHPNHGGLQGILTMGFLLAIAITFAGYLGFWFFLLSRRTVQFGTLRAAGVTRRELIGMVLLEQALTAGLSIGCGLLLGNAAARLFLPLLEDAQGGAPPFRFVADGADGLRIVVVAAVMLAAGLLLVLRYMTRLRAHEAIKLGEER
ncbi:ABC transporter permease [Paenibacillus sp.]|uniref:ABC transporter permease n=1 Tax=Paenibacillus sp. TaxID=58172 RepID=UPI002D760240|nr:FtsX-like permease family protein [Paenibacillus sp.]HZG84208.1 FtsX-like permease family protein [Paenibacillus sp.]